MIKKGRLKILHNTIFGWIFQGIFSLGKEEFIFRVSSELLIVGFIGYYLYTKFCFKYFLILLLISLFIVHTFYWLLNDSFWVYILLSFEKMKNPGIFNMLKFSLNVKLFMFRYCDLILIYGSICRNEFHERSDLDMIAVKRNSLAGFLSYPVASLIRAYAFFKKIPLSLYVFERVDYIYKRIRKDEIPIILYKRNDINLNF